MSRLQLVHKHQTRANDCWYACIQMLRTYKNGVKTKTGGAAASSIRNRGVFSSFWGHKLGSMHNEWNQILADNELQDVSTQVATNSPASIQAAVNQYGPLIVGGNFGKVGHVPGTSKYLLKDQGHYVVVVGTSGASDMIHIHDPWHTRGTSVDFPSFRAEVWRGDDRTVVANLP